MRKRSQSRKSLASLRKADAQREAIDQSSVNSPNYNPAALSHFVVDRDFDSKSDCIGWCGNVNDVASFEEVVNA